MEEDTPEAAEPLVSVPVGVAPAQSIEAIDPTDKETVLVKVQVCPPILSAKLAVPVALGVPVMV